MELCPVCGERTPLYMLEAHVNGHFDAAPTRSTRQQPDISVARCTVCDISVPLAQLDAHQRKHESSSSLKHDGAATTTAAEMTTALAPTAPPSPSTSSDVIILSSPPAYPKQLNHANRVAEAFSDLPHPQGGGGAVAACSSTFPNIAISAASDLVATPTRVSLPSVMCPYGCGQWIPVSELDSHELAHQMTGSLVKRSTFSGVAVAGRAVAGPSAAGEAARVRASGEEDEEQAVFDETDYYSMYVDDVMDDEVAAEEVARRLQEEQDFEALQAKYGFTKNRPGRCFSCGQEGHWSSECPKRGLPPALLPADPILLRHCQRPDPQSRRPLAATSMATTTTTTAFRGAAAVDWAPRLVSQLASCLEATAPPHGYEAFLSCPLQHFGSVMVDRGWGCGWRNIQMMSSALMMMDEQFRGALYNGMGFVPNIASLQAWLECAWAAGFDPLGCESLGGRIQGDRKWIGTTEAAALLRFFGVSAQIVDFEGTSRGMLDVDAGLPPGSMVGEPSDRGAVMHVAVECDLCGSCPIRGVRHRSLSRPNFDLCAACRCSSRPEVAAAQPYEATGFTAANEPYGQDRGPRHHPPAAPQSSQRHSVAATPGTSPHQNQHQHQPLVDWVWNYFSGQHEPTSGMCAQQPPRQPPNQQPLNQQPLNCQRPPLQKAAEGRSELIRQGGMAQQGVAVDATFSASTAGTAVGDGSSGGSGGGANGIAAAGTAPWPQMRSSSVTMTGMPPLYFQHEGHSRTIVGIERRRDRAGGPLLTSLLVLDPGAPSAALETALAQRQPGWQRFVRRGLHTLSRSQYQLLYVDVAAGVAPKGGSHWEALKVITAAAKYRAQL